MTARCWLNKASMWLVVGWASIGPAFAADVRGAGATFPYPIYSAWAEQYQRETGIGVEYAAIGSVAGREAIERQQVDFGATDLPLAPTELARLKLRQFPTVIGGVVPVLNITGIASGELKLTGAVLAAVYLGKLRKWNDAAIAELNPGLDLPDANITVVHRSDGSGTTRLWSAFLSGASDDWRDSVGSASTLAWPVGVAETGNEGVASAVQRTRFAVGYVEYAYARQHRLSVASLRNRDGLFVMPGIASFEAAARGASWQGDAAMTRSMVDSPGAASWPITAASFILLPTEPDDPRGSAGALAFFRWSLGHHAQTAIDLGYLPLPERLIAPVKRGP
jgi:phosphate transport system substrate-binding protein